MFTKIFVLISIFMIRASQCLIQGFTTYLFAYSFQSIRCYGYLNTQICGGFNNSVDAFNSIIYYRRLVNGSNQITYITGIQQILGNKGLISSISMPQFFVSAQKSGGIYQVDYIPPNSVAPNLTPITRLFSFDYSNFFNVIVVQDKSSNTSTRFYFFLVNNSTSTNFTSSICYRNLPVQPCTTIYTFNTQIVAATVSEMNIICILHYDRTSNQTNLSLINPDGTLIYTYKVLTMLADRFHIVSSYYYLAFSINGFIYAFDTNTKAQLWRHIMNLGSSKVKQMELIYPWLMVFQDFTLAHQFNISNGFKMQNFTLDWSYSYFMFQFLEQSQSYVTIFYITNHTQIKTSPITDTYVCSACTCLAGYILSNSVCVATFTNTITQLIASLIVTPLVPGPPPVNPGPIAQITFVVAFYICFSPPSNQPYMCDIFCSQKCNECTENRMQCSSCSQYYFMVQETKSCMIDESINVVSITYAYVNAFKNTKTMAVFAFLHNLELYQYHSIRYRGILQTIFNFTRFIQEKQWELINFGQIPDKFDNFWFAGSQYIPMTNRDYLIAERKDLTFIQNSKQYLFCYIPIIAVIFVLLNRLFQLISQFKIGKIFGNFNCWLYLPGLIVLSDTQKISYLLFMQLTSLYHFSFRYLCLQVTSILIIGIWLITSVSLFFLYGYIYKKKSAELIGNIEYKSSGIILMMIKFNLLPIVKGAIHYFGWSILPIQIILLGSIECISFFTTIYMHTFMHVIKGKLIFFFDSMLELISCYLNVLIYFKYVVVPAENQSQNAELQHKIYLIFQQSIINLVYISGCFLVASIILTIHEFISSLCCHNSQQQNEDNKQEIVQNTRAVSKRSQTRSYTIYKVKDSKGREEQKNQKLTNNDVKRKTLNYSGKKVRKVKVVMNPSIVSKYLSSLKRF